jgi:NADH-quinone oxidoreductase subunit M
MGPLSFLIFFPIVMAFVLAISPFGAKGVRNGVFITGVIEFFVSFYLYVRFEPTSAMQFAEHYPWITNYGIDYFVAIDGFSLVILMLISTLLPLAYLLLWEGRTKGYWVSMLLIQGGILGSLFAQDLILFYIFWEAMLLPVFMIIGMFGSGDKVYSTLKLTIYTIIGSLFMFVAILYLGVSFYYEFGYWSFSLEQLKNLTILSHSERIWVFLAFMLAFAIKIPLFPFHTWLPKAYSNSPTGGVFLLSSIMAKLGVYGIVRFVFPLFPDLVLTFSSWIMGLGIFGLLYFGVAALMQKDIKKMLAYSSASHLGFIVAGVFTLNVYGMMGALLLIVAHAMATGGMFLLVGHMEYYTKTKTISDLGGLAQKAPFFTFYFAIMMLCIVGLPGTNGFVSELLIIISVFHVGIGPGMVAALSVLVAASFMFWLFGRAVLEDKGAKNPPMEDLNFRQIIGLFPLAFLIIAMGLDPDWFFSKVEPTVLEYLATLMKAAV